MICTDGAGYVARLKRSKDVILADVCNGRGVAPELDAIEFYQDAYRGLRPGGIFVTNMCGDKSNCAAHITKIRNVFGDDVVMLQVPPDGNLIVFAFKDQHLNFDWDQLGYHCGRSKRQFVPGFPEIRSGHGDRLEVAQMAAGIRLRGGYGLWRAP